MPRTKVFPSNSSFDDFDRAGAGSSPDLGVNYTDLGSSVGGRCIIESASYVRGSASYAVRGIPRFLAMVDADGGSFEDDQYAELEVGILGSGGTDACGVYVRASGSASEVNGYYATLNYSASSWNLRVGKFNGNINTSLDGGEQIIDWTPGDRLGLEVTGDVDPALVVTRNGVPVPVNGQLSIVDNSGTRLLTGRPGVTAAGNGTVNRTLGDKFLAGDITPPPPPPVISAPGGSAGDASVAVNVAENQATIGTWAATNGGTWSISGGADAARVAIDGSGVVAFVSGGKDFELPDDEDEDGTYLFTVQNVGAGGAATQDVAVTLTNVNEPPGAPTIGTATAGNATVSIAFTPPAPNGGPTPTSYTATITGGITKSGAASPIVFTGADGVVNGDSYSGSVTATNSEGTGPASAASNTVTPAAVVYTATLEAAVPNTGAGVLLNQPFAWSAWPEAQAGAMGGKTVVDGVGVTDPATGEATITLPVAGTWAIWRRFTAVGTPTEDLQDVTAA